MERVHYSESDVAQEEYLDRGQFGIVFKAKLRDGKEVAIKTFKPPTNIDDEKLKTLKQKFEDEARLVSDLDHPNVVKVRNE